MEKIQPGKYVELGYDLFQINEDGSETLVYTTPEGDPEKFVFGVAGLIVPLEKAVEGLEAGGTFDVKVKADDAYGPVDPEKFVTLPKDVFEVDGKFDAEVITPGAVLPMITSDGFRVSGLVTEVTDTEVKMDFNNPLAGKDVRFKGHIITVRDATAEELQPAHECGCGCGHDHCDDGCSHDHGHDSCGCGDGCCH